jgi:hypothetical protein
MKAALWSNALFAGRGASACSRKVHEIAGSAAIIRILEHGSRSGADQAYAASPPSEALLLALLKAEIDPAALDTRGHHLGTDRRHIGCKDKA